MFIIFQKIPFECCNIPCSLSRAKKLIGTTLPFSPILSLKKFLDLAKITLLNELFNVLFRLLRKKCVIQFLSRSINHKSCRHEKNRVGMKNCKIFDRTSLDSRMTSFSWCKKGRYFYNCTLEAPLFIFLSFSIRGFFLALRVFFFP